MTDAPAGQSTPRLWEVGHPYHCADGNYLVSPADGGNREEYGSWKDFFSEHGDSDPDYILVFRWDWKRADPDDYDEDEEIPGDKLHLYVMQQRHGNFWIHVVDVTEDDEPDVRVWLTSRAKTITQIWAPIIPAVTA
jgi:hypothetical protein